MKSTEGGREGGMYNEIKKRKEESCTKRGSKADEEKRDEREWDRSRESHAGEDETKREYRDVYGSERVTSRGEIKKKILHGERMRA